MDVTLPANQGIDHNIAAHESAFLLMVKGSSTIEHQLIQVNQAVLSGETGDRLAVQAGADAAQYILGISEKG